MESLQQRIARLFKAQGEKMKITGSSRVRGAFPDWIIGERRAAEVFVPFVPPNPVGLCPIAGTLTLDFNSIFPCPSQDGDPNGTLTVTGSFGSWTGTNGEGDVAQVTCVDTNDPVFFIQLSKFDDSGAWFVYNGPFVTTAPNQNSGCSDPPATPGSGGITGTGGTCTISW